MKLKGKEAGQSSKMTLAPADLIIEAKPNQTQAKHSLLVSCSPRLGRLLRECGISTINHKKFLKGNHLPPDTSNVVIIYTAKKEPDAKKVYQHILSQYADMKLHVRSVMLAFKSIKRVQEEFTEEGERKRQATALLSDVSRKVPTVWNAQDIPGFYIDNLGLWNNERDDKPPALICGPIYVDGVTQGIAEEDKCGINVVWMRDTDRTFHVRHIQKRKLHEQSNSFMQELVDLGFFAYPHRERRLAEYLASSARIAKNQILTTGRTGWIENSSDSLVIVRSDGTVLGKHPSNKMVIYQPEKSKPKKIMCSGSVSGWKKNVATNCRGQSILTFAMCFSLLAPLSRFAGTGSNAVHIYGGTTRGKTTTTQIAASIWGNASDPRTSKDSSIELWNATSNGMEGLCAEHNDSLLPMDESGAISDKVKLGELIYMMSGGQGKAAMTKDRDLRDRSQWINAIFSSGELSMKQRIEEEGSTLKGGHQVRILDLPFGDNAIRLTKQMLKKYKSLLSEDEFELMQSSKEKRDEDSQTKDKILKAFVDDMKQACATNFGTVGRAFQRKLVKQAGTAKELKRVLAPLMESSLTRLLDEGAPGTLARTAKLFALAEAAGLIAVRFGFLPLKEEQIRKAIDDVFGIWKIESANIQDSVRGVGSVKDFIEKHVSRIMNVKFTGDVHVHNLAGYHDKEAGLFLLTSKGFKEACDRQDVSVVAKELKTRGFLKVTGKGRLQLRRRAPGSKKARWFYAVKDDILSFNNIGEHE